MKHFNQSVALVIVLFIAGIPTSHAQKDLSKWQLGAGGGIFVYLGDLTPEDMGSYKTVNPVFNFYISRIFNPYLLLRTNLALGKISGNDALYNDPVWRKERNYNFSSTVREISELLVWNMKGNNNNELGQRFSPYMFVGLGASLLTINRDFSKFNSHYFASSSGVINGLAADINHTPPNAIVVVPLGLGMEYYLTPKFSLTAETNFRYTLTDYVDGFSYGANPDKNDYYQSHTIGLLYRFGKGNKLDCPIIKQ